jgi:hypothetical protein
VRLKRARDSGLSSANLDDNLTLFELHRALLKDYFCDDIESCERLDETHFEKRSRECESKALDEVSIYPDIQPVEESRRPEERPRKVHFLSKRGTAEITGPN